MNINETETVDWLAERPFITWEPVLVWTGKPSDWTGETSIESCQPDF